MRQTLRKHERLHGKTTVDGVFSEGNSFFSYPFIVHFQPIPVGEFPPTCSVLFSVGKKRIRAAVGRNLVKRRCKEAFRKKKHLIYSVINTKNISLRVAFIWVPREAHPSRFIEKNMDKAINQLIAELNRIENL